VPSYAEKGSMDFDGTAIHIRNLNFKYNNSNEHTLHDIDLTINVGEMVAFVGPSGSGKSTILRLLVGFYQREQLGMFLGSTSSDNVSISAWRENFAYVDQSCKLFDMSIKDNILLGAKENVDDTAMINAAKQAFAHDFIEQLEEKYDSPCGEMGNLLSGGQKQRIAIARALIKGSPILVFDEATSALDSDSESYVMDTIESLRDDHTILITTHNLATITTADRIVVMDKGRIAEVGKHDELLALEGVYYNLFTNNSV
jgi:subfamily B ATP-binding cassette protein MsbA